MKVFIRSLCQILEDEGRCVVATVLESSGSTPRSSGAKMVIHSGGLPLGTIGGGVVEAMAIRRAEQMLALEDGCAEMTPFDMSQSMAANSDMICGGKLIVLLETVVASGSAAKAYAEVDRLLRRGEAAELITSFSTNGERSIAHRVEKKTGTVVPVSCLEKRSQTEDFHEIFAPPAPLYIYGAGHVSLFTAQTGVMLGFRTVVLDDRADFASRSRFPTVDELVVLDDFNDCCAEIGADAFIIIVTRGHIHDKKVLAEALKSPARYIGMIGSKKKRNAIYDALREEGYSEADIARCHSPIGLTIGAQTPEEIAVSIAAELVAVRANFSQ